MPLASTLQQRGRSHGGGAAGDRRDVDPTQAKALGQHVGLGRIAAERNAERMGRRQDAVDRVLVHQRVRDQMQVVDRQPPAVRDPDAHAVRAVGQVQVVARNRDALGMADGNGATRGAVLVGADLIGADQIHRNREATGNGHAGPGQVDEVDEADTARTGGLHQIDLAGSGDIHRRRA